MSFKIGTGLNEVTNSKERITLSSETTSNVIVIKSSTRPELNIVFDPDNTNMIFGKSNTCFIMNNDTSNIAVFSADSNTLYGTLTVGSDIMIGNNLYTSGLTTSNIIMDIDSSYATVTPYIAAYKNGQSLFSATSDGNVTIQGTAIAGQISSGRVISPIMYASNIAPLQSLNSVTVSGDLVVNGNISGSIDRTVLSTAVNQEIKNVLNTLISPAAISLSNSTSLSYPIVNIDYTRFSSNDCNIFRSTVYDDITGEKHNAFTIDNHGRVILGASNISNTSNSSILNVNYASQFHASNMLLLNCYSNQNIVVNNIGNIGIGTKTPAHRLTLYQDCLL